MPFINHGGLGRVATAAVGARTVVLIKPVAGDAMSLVDAYFAQVVPAQLRVIAVAATDVGDLESLL